MLANQTFDRVGGAVILLFCFICYAVSYYRTWKRHRKPSKKQVHNALNRTRKHQPQTKRYN